MQDMVPNVITVSLSLMDGLGTLQTAPFPRVSPSSTAFTSGSTGKPKGLMLEHVQLSTSIRDHGPGPKAHRDSR